MDEKQNFTTGSIPKKMIGFMLPILGALVLQAMYGAVDLLIVGKFGTTAGISGVATGSSVMNLFTFTTTALTTALTVVMGIYLGQGTPEKLGKLLGGAVAFFAVLAIIISVALLIFAKPLATLLQAPEEAMDLTVMYIRICGAGFLFITFYNLISAIFRGLGDSNLPLIFVGIACVVNIIGDLVLVAGLHMNTVGAAIATVLAQAVSVVLSLVIISKRKLPFTFSVKDIRFHSSIRQFIQIGTPLAVQELLTQISFLALLAFINNMGLDASSGYGVAQKIQSFVMLVPASIMQSMSTFVAQNVGAEEEGRAKKAMFFGMLFGAAIGTAIFIAIFFFGDLVSSAFTNDAAVIARSFEFLKGFAPEAIVTAVLFSYNGYFSGHSKSLFVLISSILQSFLVRLPMAYIMSIQPDASLTWVGAASPTATVFGIILCTIYYRWMQKQMRQAR